MTNSSYHLRHTSLVLALLFGACSGPQGAGDRKAVVQADAAAPSPSAVADAGATDAHTVAKKPRPVSKYIDPKKIPSLFPIGQPVVKTRFRRASTIVFGAAWGGLFPLYCYDKQRRAWATGKRCLRGVPARTTVVLSSGKVVRTRKRGKIVAGCSEGPTRTPGLVPIKKKSLPDFGVAVWPASARGSLSAAVSTPLPPKIRARLNQVFPMTRRISSLPPRPVSVLHSYRQDLDSDGHSDWLVSVVSGTRFPHSYSGLLVFLGPAHTEIRTLVRGMASGHTILATADLNGDKALEVVMLERWPEKGHGYITVYARALSYKFGCASI